MESGRFRPGPLAVLPNPDLSTRRGQLQRKVGYTVSELRLVELLPLLEELPLESSRTLGELLEVSGAALFATPVSAVVGKEDEFALGIVRVCLDLARQNPSQAFLEQPLRRLIPLLVHVFERSEANAKDSVRCHFNLARHSFVEIEKHSPDVSTDLASLIADVLAIGVAVGSSSNWIEAIPPIKKTYIAAATGALAGALGSAALHRLEPSLSLLAAWGYYDQGVGSVEALAALLGTVIAPDDEIADALLHAGSFPLAALGAARRDDFDPEVWIARILRNLSERDELILRERALSVERGLTLEALAQRLDCTRERVRQLEVEALSRLEGWLQTSACAPLRRAGRRLATLIGVAAQLDVLRDTPAKAAVDPGASPQARLGALITLYAAGQYEISGGWIVRKPAQQVVASTVLAIKAATDGGYPSLDEALAALVSAGIRQADAREWLASMPHVRVLDDYVVQWSGTLADKAETVLRVRGRPLDFDEIVDAMTGDFQVRTLRNYLSADPRFRRRGLRAYGLNEWGGEEYTTISDELAQEIERRGGQASLDDLVGVLTAQFGVSANSVRAYASGPQFERSSEGVVRVRSGSAQVPTHPVEFTKRCFRLQGLWSYRVMVTYNTVRGSGASIPQAFAGYLQLAHGGEVELAAPEQQLRFTWPSLFPSVGSIRPAVDALQATEGDYLFIAANPAAGVASIVKVSKGLLEGATDAEARLLLEVGALSSTGSAVVAIAGALGLSPAEASWSAIRRRLRTRGEEDLLALLPEKNSDDEMPRPGAFSQVVERDGRAVLGEELPDLECLRFSPL